MTELSKQALLYAYKRQTGNGWTYSAEDLFYYFRTQEPLILKIESNAAGDKPWTYHQWKIARDAIGNFYRMTLAKLADKMNSEVSFAIEEVAEDEWKKWLNRHRNPRGVAKRLKTATNRS